MYRLLCGMVLACTALVAHAQSWKPARAVELINPAAPGGSVDLMLRMFKKFVEDNRIVDVPVNVVYKTGANGAIALDYLNQHAGEGEVLFASSHTFLTIRLTGESKLDWRDMTPVGILFKEYHVTAVSAQSPLKDGRELLARMRADPSSLSFGFFGNPGNHLHLGAAIPLKAAGVDIRKMTNVPYRSGPEAIVAAIGGNLDVALVSAVVPAANVEAGKMRVLTQSGPRRLGGYLKDVPTWRELGVDVDYATAQGLTGARNAPPEAVAFWERALERMSHDPEWRKVLERSLWDGAYMDAATMKRYYEDEYAKMSAVLTELGIAKGAR